jgi:undecaprenyl diphosphate synthase
MSCHKTIGSVAEVSLIPRHIAIIMDGNGRWATKRFLPRVAGHVKGVESVRRILSALEKEVAKMHANGIRLKIVGDLSRFDDKLQKMIAHAERRTESNHKLTLTICANYGGRWDILQAMSKLISQNPGQNEFTEEQLAPHLSLAYAPDPDLFIRTGGEERISNYLLWQLAYTELYFTETYWPDFDSAALDAAIASYQNRERRFGRTSEQVTAQKKIS